MKLQTLKSFEVLNNETISLIVGGKDRLKHCSKKKDPTDTTINDAIVSNVV
jgi:hypothetical protein